MTEVSLILWTVSAAHKWTGTGIFFQFRYKKPAASLFPESQGYADMCFCQLFTAVLSFRCHLNWHVELSKGHSVEMRLCFPPQVWSFPKEFSGGSIVTGQWTLTWPLLVQSCLGLWTSWQVCFDILASGLHRWPLPPHLQVILRNVAGAGDTSWPSPNSEWSASLFPTLKLVGKVSGLCISTAFCTGLFQSYLQK